MAGKVPEGSNPSTSTPTFQKVVEVRKKHVKGVPPKHITPIPQMSSVILQAGEKQSSHPIRRLLKKAPSHERLPLALVHKGSAPEPLTPTSPRSLVEKASREMPQPLEEGMKSPRNQIGSSEAFPLKHSGRNAISTSRDVEFKEKVHKKREKLGAKKEKKHGWVAHIIRRAKKDSTLTSSLQVFNFATWISELDECEKKAFEEEFRKYDLSTVKNSDDFVRLVFDIAHRVESQVIDNVLLKEPISYLNQLRDSYETDEGNDESGMPDGLEELCSSRTIKELLDGLAKIAPSENKTMILWCMGGNSTLEILQTWLEDKHSDGMKLKAIALLQKAERESFREETFVVPRVVQMRKRAATSLPPRTVRPKELENISTRSPGLLHSQVAFIQSKDPKGSKKDLEKGSELMRSQGSVTLVAEKLPKLAKQDSEEEEELELEDKTVKLTECEGKPSSSRVEEQTSKKKKRRLFGAVTNLFHAVAKSENSKRATIDNLKKTDVSCWTHSLEHCEANTIRDLIFQEQKKNLQAEKDVAFFIEWMDAITRRVVENVIKGDYLLKSPLYFLNQLLECHKEHGNTPPFGLEELCAVTSLKEFMQKLNSLEEGEDKDLIVWSIGGDPIISIMEKWLKNEQIDDIRLKVLNYLNDIANIRRTFTLGTLQFPSEMPIPQLNNEPVVRNWFPSSACNMDRLFVNSQEVIFQKIPPPSIPYDKMSEEELLAINRIERKVRKSNLNKLLQNLLLAKEIDFSSEVKELLDKKTATALCRHKVLLLQGIEFSQPIVDVLFTYFKSLKSGLICRKGSGQFICRYQILEGRVRVSIEKHYDIYNNGLVVGSFKLNWRCLVKGPKLVAIEECKVTGLKLGACEPSSLNTHS